MNKPTLSTLESLRFWHRVTVRSMKELQQDLSARQVGILLHIYLHNRQHTIKSISEQLNISKAAVCRAVDSLSALNLLKRKKDEQDRRNVFIQRTIQGSVFLSDFADVIAQEMEWAERPEQELAA